MGFLDRVRAVRGAYRQVDANVERWARIIAIDPGPGPVTVLHLEIHSNGAPVHVEVAYTRIPRGITPAVGQDVAYRRFASPGADGRDADTYQVLWDEAPQYGSPEKVRDAFIGQALSGGPGSERERKLLVARNMLDRGVISQADYDRMISDR
ncbi:MAG TPA: hypothetical protein VGG35_06570 [Streptosporangiaceae bacterium]|jgi:hypothetical protein